MAALLIRGRRALVGVVLTAIAASAALGIYALASSEFHETEWKTLGTTGCTTAAGLLVLACLPALERRRLWPLPALGMAAALLGIALLVIGMWTEPDIPPFWKTMGTLLVAAVYATLMSLLALATLDPRFRWTLPSAMALGIVVSGLAVGAIWDGTTDGTFWRIFGGFFVLLAALTLATPVLQRVGRRVVRTAPRLRFCPACGKAVSTNGCAACGARFSVTFE